MKIPLIVPVMPFSRKGNALTYHLWTMLSFDARPSSEGEGQSSIPTAT